MNKYILDGLLSRFLEDRTYGCNNRWGIFNTILESWFSKTRYHYGSFSLLEAAEVFITELAPVFIKSEMSAKKDYNNDTEYTVESLSMSAIEAILNNLINKDFKEKVLRTLTWGKVIVKVTIWEKIHSVNFSKLIKLIFWDELFYEISTTTLCLRKREQSKIFWLIVLSEYVAGEWLRDLFKRDAESMSCWDRDKKLNKFLERMEGFWTLTKDSFPDRRYS